ncbi:hypothetical protein ACRAQ7_03825 [Erythrobacter sp. W53]|uniref:hypothetical protein n=1 Tax=Erythrobacter sp. W53 TaxID=3425947 RepID=UPI003D76905B
MTKVFACDVPSSSLLAGFGGPENYRDCFARDVPSAVSLSNFIEAFYTSAVFRPERLALGLIRRGANNADAAKLARGKAANFATWDVIERTETEILLRDFQGATASWLCAQPDGDGSTRLLFGSWLREPDRTIVRALIPFHVWYSRVLLGGVSI